MSYSLLNPVRSALATAALSLLLTHSVPAYGSEAGDSAPETPLQTCASNLKNTQAALTIWFVDHEELYPDGLSAVAPGILIEMPHCPTAPSKEYVYLREKRGKAFTLTCPGDHSEEGEDEALYLTSTEELEDLVREVRPELEAGDPAEGSEAPHPGSPTPTQDAKPESPGR